MDMQAIGRFLASLRKERGMTQEQLAQQLGTTGKTISRWETGTYLPPVEMLQQLSCLYGLTINELLQGERILPEEQSARADETIARVMRESPFLFQERQTFWRRKWQHDHRWTLLAVFAAMAAVQMAALLLDDSRLSVAGALLTMGLVVMLRNRQADYIEHHLFDDKLDFSE